MDFTKWPGAYDVILDRPYICETQLIHDWGIDHVYIHKEQETI